MTSDNLTTAANLAKALGVTEGKVKKAIAELAIAPAAKKGPCNYYDAAAAAKVAARLGVALPAAG